MNKMIQYLRIIYKRWSSHDCNHTIATCTNLNSSYCWCSDFGPYLRLVKYSRKKFDDWLTLILSKTLVFIESAAPLSLIWFSLFRNQTTYLIVYAHRTEAAKVLAKVFGKVSLRLTCIWMPVSDLYIWLMIKNDYRTSNGLGCYYKTRCATFQRFPMILQEILIDFHILTTLQ